jgi:cell division protein FtsI (penicillin-binding protein 3)
MGSRRVIKDRLGRVVEVVGEQIPPEDGRDLQLSIDSKVQFFAYQKLRESVLQNKAKAGSVVVLDAQTGRCWRWPTTRVIHPANAGNLTGSQLRNRALTDSFEPGSTMKPFVIALGLEQGLVKPETPIQTAPGHFSIGNATIRDAHPQGLLTVSQVIQKSSNVGTVKIAMRITPRDMWEMYHKLGFGQKPQLAFPGAVSGRLRPYKSWRPIEQATMSYGYGLSASLFQMARSYTVFARRKYRGWFVGMAPIDNPRIVVAVMIDEPTAGQYYGGAVAAPVFSEVVQQTLRMLGVQPDMAVRPQIVAQAAEESF